jgi:glycosyltransferase involved in cell wall biosynthesis
VRIAVIVPAFNVAPFICNALLSVLGQSHTDWLLVVVDDGSTDATAEIASAFQDSRVHLVRQDNAGASAARNHGIRVAERLAPNAFLFLDGDDWLAPNALELLSNTLEAAPSAVAACGRYARVAPDGMSRLSPRPPHGSLLEPLLTRNLFANGGHLLVRSEAVAATGDFRRSLSYGEDWEYWTRLALQGKFVALRSSAPVLFVRERLGSAYRVNATDPNAYRPATQAMDQNPAIVDRIGASRLEILQLRRDAETAWSVGRELIRHGRQRDGRHWLGRSVRIAPSFKRLTLLGLSRLRLGPFRPYQMTCV